MTQFRNTRTDRVENLTTEAAAKMNTATLKAWASVPRRLPVRPPLTEGGHRTDPLLNGPGLWETVETRIDAGYVGLTEVPVFYIQLTTREVIEISETTSLESGSDGRLIVTARPYILAAKTDAGYMTEGQRVRANTAVYDRTGAIGSYRLAD